MFGPLALKHQHLKNQVQVQYMARDSATPIGVVAPLDACHPLVDKLARGGNQGGLSPSPGSEEFKERCVLGSTQQKLLAYYRPVGDNPFPYLETKEGPGCRLVLNGSWHRNRAAFV